MKPVIIYAEELAELALVSDAVSRVEHLTLSTKVGGHDYTGTIHGDGTVYLTPKGDEYRG